MISLHFLSTLTFSSWRSSDETVTWESRDRSRSLSVRLSSDPGTISIFTGVFEPRRRIDSIANLVHRLSLLGNLIPETASSTDNLGQIASATRYCLGPCRRLRICSVVLWTFGTRCEKEDALRARVQTCPSLHVPPPFARRALAPSLSGRSPRMSIIKTLCTAAISAT